MLEGQGKEAFNLPFACMSKQLVFLQMCFSAHVIIGLLPQPCNNKVPPGIIRLG